MVWSRVFYLLYFILCLIFQLVSKKRMEEKCLTPPFLIRSLQKYFFILAFSRCRVQKHVGDICQFMLMALLTKEVPGNFFTMQTLELGRSVWPSESSLGFNFLIRQIGVSNSYLDSCFDS